MLLVITGQVDTKNKHSFFVPTVYYGHALGPKCQQLKTTDYEIPTLDIFFRPTNFIIF
jgi:hypothetical protein